MRKIVKEYQRSIPRQNVINLYSNAGEECKKAIAVLDNTDNPNRVKQAYDLDKKAESLFWQAHRVEQEYDLDKEAESLLWKDQRVEQEYDLDEETESLLWKDQRVEQEHDLDEESEEAEFIEFILWKAEHVKIVTP